MNHGAHDTHGVGPELDPHAEVQRFDLHQRLQHGLMAISFTLLVLTGWPLTTHGVGASQSLVGLFGGLEQTALLHRVAAVGMIASAVYHLIYLLGQGVRGRLRFSMLPSPKDLTDAAGNMMYFVGLRKTRPRFPRFTYFEKFDYWAVFWGVIIMTGSGTLRWFPDLATAYLPAWVYEIALHAHADEALLAALAIFLWHFYNVHLRPAVFPMSRVFITGRMTVAELEEEHGAEYDELVRQRAEAADKLVAAAPPSAAAPEPAEPAADTSAAPAEEEPPEPEAGRP
jgi:formate dehydrogenase subunit gamma